MAEAERARVHAANGDACADCDWKDVGCADIGQRMRLRKTERIGIKVEGDNDDEDVDGIDAAAAAAAADNDDDGIRNEAKTKPKPNSWMIRFVNLRNSAVDLALDEDYGDLCCSRDSLVVLVAAVLFPPDCDSDCDCDCDST